MALEEVEKLFITGFKFVWFVILWAWSIVKSDGLGMMVEVKLMQVVFKCWDWVLEPLTQTSTQIFWGHKSSCSNVTILF